MKDTEGISGKKKSFCAGKTSLRRRKLAGAKITFATAGQLLGRRFSSSDDLFSPSKLWMQTVPTEDCDVLFTFPPNCTDQTLTWLLSCLRTRLPELKVHVRHHATSKVYGLYITTSYEHLLKGADELRIRKRLKENYGGGLKEFVYDDKKCFKGVDNPEEFFSSQERQNIVLHLLNSLRAVTGDEVESLKFIAGQAIIPKCLSEGVLSQMLPLHKEDLVDDLRHCWVRAFFKFQPLDKICDYFGVKIAIYFAWLGHYTKSLMIPAFFGLFLWIIFLGRNQVMDDVCFVLFAFLNVVWATLYLKSWKRYSTELTYRWGTLDHENELLAEPRPLYRGDLVPSLVTGRPEPLYPMWKRNVFRYFVSLPVILASLGVVVAVMFSILELQEWWDKRIVTMEYPFWFTYLPKILLALVINILDSIYQKIAIWLNDQENYRLEEAYENHLIIKIVVFQFVNSFLSLFYIAFYLQDMEKLREQLAALLITRQVVGNIRESFVPFIMEQFKLAQMSFEMFGSFTPPEATSTETTSMRRKCSVVEEKESSSSEEGVKQTTTSSSKSMTADRNLSQAEVESSMYPYDGTVEDYLEMFIQFGYVILFSSAFPMAALCALLNNIVEIRSDAFKLCCIFQRPFGQLAKNIGSWQDAMEAMCVMAVIVNCALIGMSGQVHRMFPDLSTTGTIILIVVLEHVMLSLKMAISRAIPDMPQWVATEMAKIEFNRREALKKLVRTQSGTSLVLRGGPTPIIPLPLNPLICHDAVCQTEFDPLKDVAFDRLTSVVCQKLTKQLSEYSKKRGSKKRKKKALMVVDLDTKSTVKSLNSYGEDGTVVELLNNGNNVEAQVNGDEIENGYENLTAGESEEAVVAGANDQKKKVSKRMMFKQWRQMSWGNFGTSQMKSHWHFGSLFRKRGSLQTKLKFAKIKQDQSSKEDQSDQTDLIQSSSGSSSTHSET